MSSIKNSRHCLQWTGKVSLRDARYNQRRQLYKLPDLRYYSDSRPSTAAPKPLPFKPKQEPKPLVQVKPTAASKSQESPLKQDGTSSYAKQEPKGVYAPYLRISVGVVLIGSIVYSMVCTPISPSSLPD